MSVIGEAFVLIRPETTGFASSLERQVGAESSRFGAVGNLMGLAVVAGAGTALLGIGEHFDEARHKIQQETGLTGAALTGMFNTVKTVYGDVPNSLKDTVAATDLLRQRTGLTGPALSKMATQQLLLAKITGTDVATNIANGTALFAKYGIAVGQQGAKFDVLFKASQQSGVSVETLSSLLTRGGSALQQYGFNFDQSSALAANFSKILGTSAPRALTALTTGFAKIAKAGDDPHRVLLALIHDVEGGKPKTVAMAEAMHLLGARGGLELVTAIQKGAFSISGMLGIITSGKGGITATAFETLSLGEKFDILKHKVLDALEPIASKVAEFVNKYLTKITEWIDTHGKQIAATFNEWKVPLIAAAGALALFFAPIVSIAVAIGLLYAKSALFRNILNDIAGWITNTVTPALISLYGWLHDKIGTAFTVLAAWIRGTAIPALHNFYIEAHDKLVPVVQAIGHWITGSLVPAFEHFVKAIRPVVAGIGDFLKTHPQVVFAAIAGALLLVVSPIALVAGAFVALFNKSKPFHDFVMNTLLPALKVFASFLTATVVPAVEHLVRQMLTGFGSLVSGVQSRWADISKAIENVLKVLKVVVTVYLAPIFIAWKLFHDQILAVVMVAWNLIGGIVKAALDILRGIFDVVLGLLSGDWSRVWMGLHSIVEGVWQLIHAVVVAAFGLLRAAFFAGLHLIEGAWRLFWHTILPGVLNAAWSLVKAGVVAGIKLIVNLFLKFPIEILTALGKLGVHLIEWAVEGFAGLVAGLPAAAANLFGWFGGIGSMLLGYLGNAGSWLVKIGGDALRGLWDGAQSAWAAGTSFLTGLPGRILSLIGDAHHWLRTTGHDMLYGFLDAVKSTVGDVWAWLVALPGQILAHLSDARQWLHDKGAELIHGFLNAVTTAVVDVWKWFEGLPGKIVGKLGDVGSALLGAGKNFIAGLIKGIEAGAKDLFTKLEGIGKKAIHVITHPWEILSPSHVMDRAGQDFIFGATVGVNRAAPDLYGALNAISLKALEHGNLMPVGATMMEQLGHGVDDGTGQVVGKFTALGRRLSALKLGAPQLGVPSVALPEHVLASLNATRPAAGVSAPHGGTAHAGPEHGKPTKVIHYSPTFNEKVDHRQLVADLAWESRS